VLIYGGRYFITQALLDGVSTLEVTKIVGTSLAMIEKHYGHLVADTARAPGEGSAGLSPTQRALHGSKLRIFRPAKSRTLRVTIVRW
jgi:hypothetical protein